VLGSERDGGFAELVAVPAVRVHPVVDSPLSDVERVALPIAYGTALGRSDRAAVRLRAALGARVVGVCSASKADAVRAAGADAVVVRDDDPLTAAADAAPGLRRPAPPPGRPRGRRM